MKLEERTVEMGEVIVTSERRAIDPVSTTNGKNLRDDELQPLPLQRDYRQIANLLPQATINYQRDGLSIQGGTGLENKYYIQGTDVTDAFGQSNINTGQIPYNFVKEVQVRAGGYEAEYESSLGGVINVLTHSGSNEFHGQAFGFYTNSSLSGAPISIGTPPNKSDRQYDVGIGFGGPVVRDRLWFYAAYNPQFGNEVIPLMGQGDQDFASTVHIFAGKFSWLLNEDNRLEFSTFGDPRTQKLLTNIPLTYRVLNVEPAMSDQRIGNVHTVLSGNHILSDRLLLETALRWSRFYEVRSSPEAQRRLGMYYIDRVDETVSGGPNVVVDDHSDIMRASAKLTWMTETHTVKAGLEFKNLYRLNNSQQFYLARYGDSLYMKLVYTAGGTVSVRIPALFAQDSWQIIPQVRLNIGVRWDPTYLIGTDGRVAQKILGQVAPRMGVVYIPGKTGTEKITLSAGRFYQNLAPCLSNMYHSDVFVNTLEIYDHDPRTNPAGGDTAFALQGKIYPEVSGLKGQYLDELALGYERALGGSVIGGIRAIYRNLGMGIEDVIDPSTGFGIIGNPGYGALSAWPKIRREYKALELTLARAATEGFGYQVSYVLSRLYGNHPGLTDLEAGFWGQNATGMYDLQEQLVNGTGLLQHDRTHTLKSFATYRFDFGLSIGTSLFWATGTPLSERGGTSSGPPYHSFISQRGTAGRTPSVWDVNVRLTYDVAPWLSVGNSSRIVVDVFHLASDKTPVEFDDVKYYSLDASGNQADPNPNYGKPIRFQPPMSVRLGLEVNF